MIGRVVSTKMKNTATVLVERVAKHPLYKKTYIQTKRYLVDAEVVVKDGDMVEIIKVRPISKNKHWKINRVVGRNLAEITEEKLKAQAEEVIAQVMPEEKESSDMNEELNNKQEVTDEKAKKPERRARTRKLNS